MKTQSKRQIRMLEIIFPFLCLQQPKIKYFFDMRTSPVRSTFSIRRSSSFTLNSMAFIFCSIIYLAKGVKFLLSQCLKIFLLPRVGIPDRATCLIHVMLKNIY